MKLEKLVEDRIKAEYRKHPKLDWAKIAAVKISSSVSKVIDDVIGEDRVITRKENNSQEGVNLMVDYELCRKIGWNNAKGESRQSWNNARGKSFPSKVGTSEAQDKL